MDNSQVYKKLRDKWITRHIESQKSLFEKHGATINNFVNNTRNFAVGSASALMLLSSPATNFLPPPHTIVHEAKIPVEKSVFVASDLSSLVPDEVRELTPSEESSISGVLTRDFGIKVVPELNGIRLNRTYGLIGAEQHLMRYPGDTMDSHFDKVSDDLEYRGSGMAPGLGGWGYFAKSKEEMTQKDADREKYYIAVQSFLAPGFAENTREYISFFKFRKMLVVNPDNGHAIVADIGDAGPGIHTGKHLGGSPEVMRYLERVDGAQKGGVLYFFIDDPKDEIPLGPIETKQEI
ncbi:MAG TPA: hypothetical protein VG965_05015 [Patescibacteria group bacterium]|nr:hypothetical protein [Patescibacteria group bacterium]